MVTGIIIFANVLKGQRNALKCVLSKEPITVLVTYHAQYPAMALEPQNVRKAGGHLVLEGLGFLSVFWPQQSSSQKAISSWEIQIFTKTVICPSEIDL